MTHAKPTYTGRRRLDDHSLSPHPKMTFPVHRDSAGNLRETSSDTPFPVLAGLEFTGGLGELLEVLNALLVETRIQKLHLQCLSGEEFTVDDVEVSDVTN